MWRVHTLSFTVVAIKKMEEQNAASIIIILFLLPTVQLVQTLTRLKKVFSSNRKPICTQ